jgi:hypothetical protein
MTKQELLRVYRAFLVAFDLEPDDVVLDKTCMDVLDDEADEVEKLSMLLPASTHRFVKQIIDDEAGNPSMLFQFLRSVDPHLLVGDVERMKVGVIVGSTTSFLNKPKHTLH